MTIYKNELFHKALELYINSNLNQKEIALKLGITEKTISKWLKDLKEKKKSNVDNIKLLNNKLNNLLNDENASLEDIKNITKSISDLENIWFNNYLKKHNSIKKGAK